MQKIILSIFSAILFLHLDFHLKSCSFFHFLLKLKGQIWSSQRCFYEFGTKEVRRQQFYLSNTAVTFWVSLEGVPSYLMCNCSWFNFNIAVLVVNIPANASLDTDPLGSGKLTEKMFKDDGSSSYRCCHRINIAINDGSKVIAAIKLRLIRRFFYHYLFHNKCYVWERVFTI